MLASPHPFVVLVGPHGTGKTTALHTYAREQADAGQQVAWFSLGEEPAAAAQVVVLDDAQNCPPRVWEELADLTRRRQGLRIRVTTTTASLIPSGLDAVVHEVPYLDDERITHLLAEHGSIASVDMVRHLTGGHPASVRRIAESGATRPDDARAALAAPTSTPRVAASEESLAVPAHLSTELVARLGGPEHFIDRTERAGHGRWTGSPGHRLFVLVPTVREATLARLSPTTSGRVVQIRSSAAAVHLAGDEPYAAFVEAVGAGDFATADRAMKLGGLPLLNQHGYAIKTLLEPVSLRTLSTRPTLAFTLALILNARRQNRLRALEVLAVAVMAARLPGGRAVADRALVRVVESVALRISGAGDGGLSAARKAARMMAEMGPEERLELGSLAPDLHAHLAVSFLSSGHDEEAFEQFELAADTQPRAGVELMALGGLALIEALRGDGDQAGEWLRVVQDRNWPEELLHSYSGCFAQIAEALLAIERLDLAAARAALDSVWSMIETIEHWPLLAHARALTDLADGRASAGLEEFRALRRRRTSRLGSTDWVRNLLDVTESLLLLGTGEAGAAKTLLGNGRATEVLLARARVALVLDDSDAALTLLGQAQPAHPNDRMSAAALRSVLLRRSGQEEERQQSLDQVRAIHRSHGLCSPLFFLPHGELAHFDDFGDLPQTLRAGVTAPRLTDRELVVLRELVVTSDIRDVADALHVSVNTVKSQRRTLYRKLGAASREEAVTAALVYGLLEE